MLPYIVLYVLLFVVVLAGKMISDKHVRKGVCCFVVFTAILLLVGLRHPTMGLDLAGYLQSYHRLHDMSWTDVFALDSYLNYEKGYVIFNKIIATITFGSEQIFLFVCAMLATVPIGYTIYKKSQDTLLSTVIYLALPIFLIQYSALRQGIALGICFLSLTFIEEKKFWRFVMLILLATCFHYTSVLFVLAYVVYHVRIPEKARWGLLLLFPVVFVFRLPLFNMLSRLLKTGAVATQTNAVTMMLVFCMIYIFIVFLFHGENEDAQANGYMNLFFCACICQIFSGVYSTAIRVGYYFMIALVLLLPMAIGRIKDERIALILRWGIIVCFVWFAFDSIIDSSWAKAYPYYFFWQTPTWY